MRTVIVPASEQKETVQSIVALSISYINRTAEVGYAFGQMVDGVFEPDMSTVKYESVDFEDLMSGQPTWSPQKPAGSFRPDDLLSLLDEKVRKEEVQRLSAEPKSPKGKKK